MSRPEIEGNHGHKPPTRVQSVLQIQIPIRNNIAESKHAQSSKCIIHIEEIFIWNFVLFCFLWDRVSIYSLDWCETLGTPASVSQVAESTGQQHPSQLIWIFGGGYGGSTLGPCAFEAGSGTTELTPWPFDLNFKMRENCSEMGWENRYPSAREREPSLYLREPSPWICTGSLWAVWLTEHVPGCPRCHCERLESGFPSSVDLKTHQDCELFS